MKNYGIDVSHYQGNIDWNKAKSSGIKYMIIKAGYGRVKTQIDECFETNYKGCKANNIPCGAYWYSYAMSESEAKLEAQACINALKGKQFEYPIYFDVEESKQIALGKAKLSAIVKTFLLEVEKAGYWVGLYMSSSPLTTHITDDVKKRFSVWVANVADKYGNPLNTCTYKGTYGMWQYSWVGKVNGISGDVDTDWCTVDYPKQIKAKGLNGFTKSVVSNATAPAAATTSKVPTYSKGQKITLKNANLYASETSTKPVKQLSGTYYIYDSTQCKLGRYRVTNSISNCGKKPAGNYVTGYVAYTNFK